ncbi:hypothetical protein KOW79_006653 [Hemibagrus wyckioides]|uniref:Uncharacterized protein n=1 Tax=Hemibagrus wyckioides TaxID=337641 RepID=A0A9D3NW87_9TELE|nr:hypothetical protein KOW79_006653 [Hemibagrus wyckioides]
MGGIISYFFGEIHPTEVTDVQQTEDSSPVSSSSPNPEEEKSELPYVPQCTISDTPLNTTTTESIFQTTGVTDHTEDVEKINIYEFTRVDYVLDHPKKKVNLDAEEAVQLLEKFNVDEQEYEGFEENPSDNPTLTSLLEDFWNKCTLLC